MSTLILLRHGQASFGAQTYDALSPLGHEQAKAVGRHFQQQRLAIDRVQVGPRQRHLLTAELALAPLGLEWDRSPHPALDEFAEGQQILAAAQARQSVILQGEGRLSGKAAARCYFREIEAWCCGLTQIPGVPEVGVFRREVGQWCEQTLEEAASGVNLLAVTSGGVIAALLANALGLPDSAMARFMGVIYNASITELAFSRGRPPSLLSFNQVAYLEAGQLSRV